MGQVEQIASTHLGKTGGYKDQYDPSLLVKVPRKLNRIAYEIDDEFLPFWGYDLWKAYEVSALTEHGFPVTGMLQISYNASSLSHVESKSLKLYLNSFNMTEMGSTIHNTKMAIANTVETDLTKLLETPVTVVFFDNSNYYVGDRFASKFFDIGQVEQLDHIDFNVYNSDPSLLKFSNNKRLSEVNPSYKVAFPFLRSNCRVTNQPDWGTLFVEMTTTREVNLGSIAQYVVSHRKVNHFHEEIVEMSYIHLMRAFAPIDLTVAALYTRRGGIDINPIRSTSQELIPNVFKDAFPLLEKTLAQ